MNTFRFLLFLSLLASGSTAAAATVYQCPMHPWIKSDHPGKCTICGMDLVAADATKAASPEGVVTLSSSQVTVLGVETTPVVRQALTRTLRVTGQIDDDDTRHRVLAARVPGRIEQLHVNSVGAEVAAGAPLVTIYSPDMLTAQRVFVQRVKAGESAYTAADRAEARERLLELGLTEPEIQQLEKSLQPAATITVRAPMSGTVVSKSVYEGQYVQTTDRLFEIADFSSMWFLFDAYEQDLPWLRVGQTVDITTRAVPGETIRAPIAFIDPNFNETTRTTKVRVVLPNPHFNAGGEHHTLPHRVLAEGRVQLASPAVLSAPRSAILDAGTGPVAYVDAGSRTYEPRLLTLGRRGDASVEVLSGLTEGERVVTNGALLIDAQAQLGREASNHRPANSGATPAVSGSDNELSALGAAAADAADALATDDFAGYQKLSPALQKAAKAFPALPPLEPGTDLATARRSFEPWSTAVADFLKPRRAQLGLKIFQCPMTPVLKTGRWVQRSAPVKNPFFGSAMLTCGEELR